MGVDGWCEYIRNRSNAMYGFDTVLLWLIWYAAGFSLVFSCIDGHSDISVLSVSGECAPDGLISSSVSLLSPSLR